MTATHHEVVDATASGGTDCDEHFSDMCRCVRETGHAGDHACLCDTTLIARRLRLAEGHMVRP